MAVSLERRTGIVAFLYWLWDGIDRTIFTAIKFSFPARFVSPFGFLGMLTFVVFIILGVSGALLMFYYQPILDRAWDSVQFINDDVPFGFHIRNIHYHGSNAMVLLAVLHMYYQYFSGRYKIRNEVLWMTGVILGVVTILEAFTGYDVIFSERAELAISIAASLTTSIPVVGPTIRDAALGSGFSDFVLRFYAQHVFLLPIVMLGLMAVHFPRFLVFDVPMVMAISGAILITAYGLILAVGPTGSGKTTTLHSALGYINTPKKKIWTAEDPVEITQRGLRQLQTHNKIGLDFARAMRSFLRGDPDVIMVGEMRDVETCSIGLEASLTGHLVFSTLHTNSAPETITRLIDMGMNPINFADALILISAQRLVKTLCKNCKKDYHPTREEFDILVEEYGATEFLKLGIEYNDDLMLKGPVGCNACGQTGYDGRTGLHELLEGTREVKRLIMKGALMEEIQEQAIRDGMTTLKQDGIQKIFKGDCDYKQVAAVCVV